MNVKVFKNKIDEGSNLKEKRRLKKKTRAFTKEELEELGIETVQIKRITVY